MLRGTISLRDEFGRPAWSGAGRRAVGEQASGEDTEPGQGGRGQGRRGRDQEEAPLSGWGVGQALVDEWLIVQGTVTGIDVNGLVVQTTEGQEFIVENRPWWFVQEQGFSAEVGDEVELVGFYEADEYEVGQITNVTRGQIVPIREENGRPLWAGGGRRGG